MQSLYIKFENGSWLAQVSNTEVQYTFSGLSANGQRASVLRLANTMKLGRQLLISRLRLFFNLPQGTQSEEVVNTMFGTTDKLFLNETFVYGASEESLLVEVEDAGADLAAFLAA